MKSLFLPFIFLSLYFCSFSSYSQQNNRLALVVGNSSYKFATPLIKTKNDAKLISQTLSDLGYKATLLWDLDEITFKKEFEKFKNKVTTNDEVIFYFAGHGLEILGANYLLPTDIKFDEVDEIKEHSVLLQNFLESMNERKSKLTLAIIDTSRDNPFKNQGRLVGAPTSPFAGQIVAFSSSIGQSPLDYLGPHDINPNGLFARVFVQEIKIPGQLIEVTLNNVRGKVKNLADSANYLQVPNVNTSLINSYYLNK